MAEINQFLSSDAEKQIKELVKLMGDLAKSYEQAFKSSKKLDEHQEELTKIDSALPSEFSAPSLLKFLQKIAPENGLVLTAVSSSLAQPLSQRNDIKEIQSSLSLSGSYSSLKNFLKVLEKSARLIKIDSVSFSTSQKKEGETAEISKIFDFQLEVKTYSY